jgi:two-component system NtrC family sensor kinase
MAAFVMGIMVLMRQSLLERELTQLLQRSRESYDKLHHLQAQLLQSEKIASIGQLVGGAAHELNNPITAMLGYSDMLLSTQLTPEQRPLAAKIGQYVRRTKSLVASLISFARQTPTAKSPVDLNTLARTAVKLTQSQWEALEIEVRTQFDLELPKVLGDSNQLLQVCQQLVANCLHLLSDSGARVLTISTERKEESSVLQIACAQAFSSTDAEVDSLGMSACQGILQEHRGRISRELGEDGAILLRVELPIMEPAASRMKESIPGRWQSQPFA